MITKWPCEFKPGSDHQLNLFQVVPGAIAVIAVEPMGKASFVHSYVQTRLSGQCNGKWPFSLVYVLKPLITAIRAIPRGGFNVTSCQLGFLDYFLYLGKWLLWDYLCGNHCKYDIFTKTKGIIHVTKKSLCVYCYYTTENFAVSHHLIITTNVARKEETSPFE